MYNIEYVGTVVRKDIPRLQTDVKKRIKTAIEEKLQVDPISFGKPLRYSLEGLRRLRVGDYRIVYTIEASKNTVLIVKIGHRKEVYE
jgi:mRNA interferase RelE/StbE